MTAFRRGPVKSGHAPRQTRIARRARGRRWTGSLPEAGARPALNRPRWRPTAIWPAPSPCNWPSPSSRTRDSWRRPCAARCWPHRVCTLGGGHRHRRSRLPQHPAASRRPSSRSCARCWRPAGFGQQPPNGQRMMVEFVSANPTGPLHVGHGRQAALGDAICNLFATQGWESTASSITTTPACRSPRWPTAPSCAPRGSSRR
jgi:hypothetical protein